MLKRTALHEEHLSLKGRLIDFGGWELPVQYSGVIPEHLACRSSVGIFDVSHMGEFFVEGNFAKRFLNILILNDVSKLDIGQAQYSAICNERGYLVDDLVIYRRGVDRFMVVVNASNTAKDFRHIKSVQESFESKFGSIDLWVTDESARFSQIALQGRNAETILQSITEIPLKKIKTYWFSEGILLDKIQTVVARTGYTGEDGFELYIPWLDAPRVWRALLAAGEKFGITPCGLGARDTLRLEMSYPLYGHELNESTGPLEAGLGWITKLYKEDFVGKSAILKMKECGPRRKLVGIKLLDRGIPRQGYKLYLPSQNESVGEISSGTQSPSLSQAIGIAHVHSMHAGVGKKLEIDIRGKRIPAVICETPFYRPPYQSKLK